MIFYYCLLGNGALNKKEQIEEISSKASGEAQIEFTLQSICKKWEDLNFIVTNYRELKEKFIIGSVEEIF